MRGLQILPVGGFGEIGPGADLPGLIGATAELRDGDILAVTSKIVSKAEGRRRSDLTREQAIDAELVRLVARRGPTRIGQTRHGLVLAAAGVDGSNTAPGTVLLLPVDPDASARRLRAALLARFAVNVAVVVTDTLGRPWREGQIDLAIGAAGLPVLDDLRGTPDSHGNTLEATLTATADEIAAAGELVKGKAAGIPVAVLRGLGGLVLPSGDDGPGAAALVRAPADDLFSLGTREAAIAAVTARRDAVTPRELPAELWQRIADDASLISGEIKVSPADGAFGVWAADPVTAGRVAERLAVLLHAEGYGVTVRPGPAGTATVTFGSPSLTD